MTDAARTAAVMLRIGAAAMILYVAVSAGIQIVMLLLTPSANVASAIAAQVMLVQLLILLPAVWVYRKSRQLGIRFARGLDP